MGRGGERVETPESLAYTAKRTAALKGKISWEEGSRSVGPLVGVGRGGWLGWLWVRGRGCVAGRDGRGLGPPAHMSVSIIAYSIQFGLWLTHSIHQLD